MDILVCFKLSPDSKDILVSNGAINTDRAEWNVGEYDLVAVEAAAQLAAASGRKLIGVSVGGSQLANTRFRKNMLSRGCDSLSLVMNDALVQADTHKTAAALAAAVTEIGNYDLIVCGEGSQDLYFRQTGVQLGELLELPVINGISALNGIEGSVLLAERSTDSGIEVLEIPLPAVVCVTSDICQSRIPKMKDILQAGRKPVKELDAAGIPCNATGSEIIKVALPKSVQRKAVNFSGTPEEIADQIVAMLAKEGLMPGGM